MPSHSYSELLEFGLPGSTFALEKKRRLNGLLAAAAGMMTTMQSQPADAIVDAAPMV